MSEYVRECFTCAKIGLCAETDVKKVLSGFVCPLFAPVAPPVIEARSAMVEVYDAGAAVRALLRQQPHQQEETPSMAYEAPPPGTSYTDRKKQLEIMSFMDVRVLGNKKYKAADGTPVLDWNETLQVDTRAVSIEKVLQFELANNIIVPDGAAQQIPQVNQQPMQNGGVPQMPNPPFPPPNGAPQMPQAFQPQGAPPQMPMPPAPPQMAPPQPGVPMMPQQPGMMPQAPFGMAPGMQQPPGPPMMPPPPGQMAPPMAAPPMPPAAVPGPIASPEQAAAAPQAAPATGKKKRGQSGSAAAPPPPPPPGFPQQQAPVAAPQGYAPPPAQPGFAPATPSFGPPTMAPPQVQQPAPQMATPQVPVALDITPVVQLVDTVGKAVNGLGGAQAEATKALQAAIGEVKQLLLAQLVATYHLHLANERIAPTLQQQGITDAAKFIQYLNQWVPR